MKTNSSMIKRFFASSLALLLILCMIPMIPASAAVEYVTIYLTSETGGYAQGDGEYEIGDTVVLEAYAEDGYIFDGWYENGARISTTENYSFTAASDRTLEARFKYNYVTITVTSGTGGYVDGTVGVISGNTYSDMLEKGETVSLVAWPDGSYIFDGWFENGVRISSTENYSFTAASDRTLVAKFKYNRATITVTAGTGGYFGGDGEYNKGDTVVLEAYTEGEYIFDGWYENGVRISTSAIYSFIATTDRTLVAWFEIIISIDAINIIPASESVEIGKNLQFYAEVIGTLGTGEPPQTVTWTVDGGGAGTSISSSGLLAVAADETAHTLTVRAISTVDTSISGIALVTVTIPPPPGSGDIPTPPPKVTVSPATAVMQRGTNWQFSASVEGLPQGVTWTVAGGGAGTSISSSGLLTVAENEVASTLTVRARSTTSSTVSGTSTVWIANSVSDTSLSSQQEQTVTGSTTPPSTAPWIGSQTLPEGQIRQIYGYSIQATGNTPMTWSIISGYLPSGLSLNTNSGAISGTPTTIGTFNFTVMATNSSGSATRELRLIVTELGRVTAVTINPPNPSVQRGAAYQFSASITGAGSPVQTVLWYVSGGSSSGTTISSNGLLTVSANETANTLLVRASSTVNSAISGIATVTVTGSSSSPPVYSSPYMPSQDTAGTAAQITYIPEFAGGGLSISGHIGNMVANRWEKTSFGREVFTIEGCELSDFVAFYFNGDLLTRGVDYQAEAGSVIITIPEQTFQRYGEGTHTLTAEFNIGGDKKSVSQTFTLRLTPQDRALPQPITFLSSSAGGSDSGEQPPFGRPPQTGIADILGIFAVFCANFAIAASLWIYIILKKKAKRANGGNDNEA